MPLARLVKKNDLGWVVGQAAKLSERVMEYVMKHPTKDTQKMLVTKSGHPKRLEFEVEHAGKVVYKRQYEKGVRTLQDKAYFDKVANEALKSMLRASEL